MYHLTTIECTYCLIGAVTFGALLMYRRMIRRLDRDVAAARRCGDILLTEQRQRHQREFDRLTRDYHDLMADQRQAILLCEQLARDIGQGSAENRDLLRDIVQLTAENDTLRLRQRQVSWKMNAWGPKTERGQA
jgi:hypothetical protein